MRCVCAGVWKVEGTFRVRKPAVLLGYTHDSYGTPSDVMAEASGQPSADHTYVTLFVTMEPQLAAPEPFREKVCSQLFVPFSNASDFIQFFCELFFTLIPPLSYVSMCRIPSVFLQINL